MQQSYSQKYECTWQDRLEADAADARYMGRTRVARISLFILFVFLGAGFLGDPRRFPLGSDALWKASLCWLALIGFVMYLLDPKNIVGMLIYWLVDRSRPLDQKWFEWGFDPEMVLQRNSLSSHTFRWQLFSTIVELPKCVLFYDGRKGRIYIPSHAFASLEVLQEFRQMSQARVAKYLVLGECLLPAKPEPIGLAEL